MSSEARETSVPGVSGLSWHHYIYWSWNSRHATQTNISQVTCESVNVDVCRNHPVDHSKWLQPHSYSGLYLSAQKIQICLEFHLYQALQAILFLLEILEIQNDPVVQENLLVLQSLFHL